MNRRILLIVSVLFGPGCLWFGGKALYNLRPLAPLPGAAGVIVNETSSSWARLNLADGCAVVNNTWNSAVAGRDFHQSIFVEQLRGEQEVGWRWRTPWQLIPTVVSQPQLVCGDKPWDPPLHLRSEFPFAAGNKNVVVDFNAQLRGSGTYNMALTLWAVSSLPASKSVITHEIMIWTLKNGEGPAGKRVGKVNVAGTKYDVYVEKNHKDASGLNANTWTYVAFVPERAVLQGPLQVSAFTDYLLQHGSLSPRQYLTSIEFGNEVCEGSGIVEINNFALRFN